MTPTDLHALIRSSSADTYVEHEYQSLGRTLFWIPNEPVDIDEQRLERLSYLPWFLIP